MEDIPETQCTTTLCANTKTAAKVLKPFSLWRMKCLISSLFLLRNTTFSHHEFLPLLLLPAIITMAKEKLQQCLISQALTKKKESKRQIDRHNRDPKRWMDT
jgi:hypothetical protein